MGELKNPAHVRLQAGHGDGDAARLEVRQDFQQKGQLRTGRVREFGQVMTRGEPVFSTGVAERASLSLRAIRPSRALRAGRPSCLARRS